MLAGVAVASSMGAPNSHGEDNVKSINFDNFSDSASIKTDIVIPASLIPSESAPYAQSSRRKKDSEDVEVGRAFDLQEIAYHHKQDVKRVMRERYVRSASIAIGALERSRVTGFDTYANDYVVSGTRAPLRKTSLSASQEPTLDQGFLLDKRNYTTRRPSNLSVITRGRSPTSREKFGSFYQPVDSYFTRLQHEPSRSSSPGSPKHVSFPRRVSDPQTTHNRAASDNGLNRETTKASRATLGAIAEKPEDAIVNPDVLSSARRGSLYDLYELAKKRGAQLQRKKWVMHAWEYACYALLVAFVYFVLIGVPLWNGAVWWLWWVFVNRFSVGGTWIAFVGLAAVYAYAPLLVLFEKAPDMPPAHDTISALGVGATALVIPCYKSEKIIGPTLEAALKIFPSSHIFVIANGNSPTPLDNTEEVCTQYGVNHVWSPIGSKIVAQYVGCYAAKGFKYVLLIDDDCALPPNFPVVSDRMTETIKCIGYTIKSVGPKSSRGNLCQQAQDIEYKISGIQRALAGKLGSATFPHGAIVLWDSKFLIETFFKHPGFNVSEDWFFGHVARELGSRITMCTSVLIETETPNAVFFSSGGSRGGFGEMTIFKQRFLRWNFFFVNGLWFNTAYIVKSWRLGWAEIGAKLFVFQEVYETLLYLLAPFVIPISFLVQPAFTAYTLVGTFGIYFLNVIIFNEIHLRLKHERVPSKCVYLYYMPYKVILTLVNIASCYWSLYKYAKYFARRHPRIVEDERAVDVVLRMQETAPRNNSVGGRRMSVVAVGSQIRGSVVDSSSGVPRNRKATITTIGREWTPGHLGSIQENGRAGSVGGNQIVSVTMDDRTFSFAGPASTLIPPGADTLQKESSDALQRFSFDHDNVAEEFLHTEKRTSTETTRTSPPSRTLPIALRNGYSYQRSSPRSENTTLPTPPQKTYPLARALTYTLAPVHNPTPPIPSSLPNRGMNSFRTSSSRSNRSMRSAKTHETKDFEDMDYGELLVKLAAIEERLRGLDQRLEGVLGGRGVA